MTAVSCPFCSASQKLPQAAAGQTARCTACGKTFMVPTAAVVVPVVPLGPSRPPHTVSIPVSPAHAPTLTAGVQPLPVPVPTGTPQPAPQDGSSIVAPVGDLPASSLSLILLVGVACFILGGLLLLVVIIRFAHREHEPDRPMAAGTSQSSSSRIIRRTPDSSRNSDWSNVSQGVAIDLNSLAVDVQYVGYGEVRAKDAQNRVVVSDRKNYFQVYLKIKNLGGDPVKYISWQGNSFSADGLQVRCTLADDSGRSYAMQEFAHVAGLQGHTPRAILASQEEIEDVVVFTIPDNVSRRTIRHFHLELPAEAYGGSGVYRFEIPAQSIQGF